MSQFVALFAHWLVGSWLLRPSNGQQLRAAFGRVDDWRGSRWQWGVAVVRSRPVPQSTPELRFQSPLVAPDVQISRIRRSDKTSRLHPRHVVPKPAQAYEHKVPVKMREWIGPALASHDLVLEAQPPA